MNTTQEITLENIAEQAIAKLKESPLNSLLGDALKDCMAKQEDSLEELIQARKDGEITTQEFEIEIQREQKILEAEMLSLQITAKAEIQKLVNGVIQALSKGLI